MQKREFLMLAHTYNPAKHDVTGWYASEKLDGIRAFWDGGVSRGMSCKDVPYANTVKDKCDVIATGLWTRKAKPIMAPAWFLDALPRWLLDGELWLGRGMFQQTSSIVRTQTPGPEWKDIKYKVFDSPAPSEVFQGGTIYLDKDNSFSFQDATQWWRDRADQSAWCAEADMTFEQRCMECPKLRTPCEPVTNIRVTSLEYLPSLLDGILEEGGEGIILRKPLSYWRPKRVHTMLKLKPFHDAEATVVGWNPGKGKLEGMMGNLIVEWEGKTFELSGFTDEERLLRTDFQGSWPEYFPHKSKVTFRYRELTDAGIPKEARFLRRYAE